jgi:hypothetical protein
MHSGPDYLHGLLDGLQKRPPATDAAIVEGEKPLGRKLPSEYVEFLRLTNGCEGFVGGGAYVMLWEVEELASTNVLYEVQKHAPGLLTFGRAAAGKRTVSIHEYRNGRLFECLSSAWRGVPRDRWVARSANSWGVYAKASGNWIDSLPAPSCGPDGTATPRLALPHRRRGSSAAAGRHISAWHGVHRSVLCCRRGRPM